MWNSGRYSKLTPKGGPMQTALRGVWSTAAGPEPSDLEEQVKDL